MTMSMSLNDEHVQNNEQKVSKIPRQKQIIENRKFTFSEWTNKSYWNLKPVYAQRTETCAETSSNWP